MTRHKLPAFFSDETFQSPFFASLQKEVDQVFDRFKSSSSNGTTDLFGQSEGAVVPALDIAESDTAIEITAEIPGVAEEDLDVSVTGDVLIVKGEKSSDHEEKEKNYHLVERRYGSFRRSVPLGFTPENDKVEATFKNGVLKLKIEKPAEAVAKTQKIEIAAA